MPPKKSAVAAENDAHADGSNGPTMSADEQQFLIDCLMCPVGGALAIDTKAVAERRNQKSAASVSNRIALMKKRYGIPFGSAGAGARKPSDAGAAAEVTVPKTPNKNKVTKARATSAKKGTAKKVASKAVNSDDDDETTSKKEESDDEALVVKGEDEDAEGDDDDN